jgi:MFS transporter, DHA1 family, multidrug resistance protein
MLGSFSIDAYLPAFAGIMQAIGATPVEMQQTLSAYLFGFAIMNLFHGAMSDSLGRRPVVLSGIALFTVASVGCALAEHIGQLLFWRTVQGMSAGVGIVVSRAIIRDMFAATDAQGVLSQVNTFYCLAPAIAPMVGGLLFVQVSWQAVFWLLAGLGAVIWVASCRLLPETLHPSQRQPFNLLNLMRGYRELGGNLRLVMLALASGIPFNGVFLYVLCAPVFLGEHLHLAPDQFFWFFALTIACISGGSWLSGHLAGKMDRHDQIRQGFRIMLTMSIVNMMLNLLFVPHASWAMLPIAIYSFGWALMVPVVSLTVLDLAPQRRGMASSFQAFIHSMVNGIVAGVVAPLAMHSPVALALTSLLMMVIGVVAWIWVKPRVMGEAPARSPAT